jgi:hypothetical protein
VQQEVRNVQGQEHGNDEVEDDGDEQEDGK